jgi:cytochrome bd ubiquinol oxidase subunit I
VVDADPALPLHRLTFAFTINYHYLFPQITMGLALLIAILKTLALRSGEALYDGAARFWARLFGITFAMGVVTGIPMEFQFGTHWARFSQATGGVIGQLLAMEGVFAFFLESSLLGAFLYGERRLSRRAHWLVAVLLWLGTWWSAFFICATDAWMQHPVGYSRAPDGVFQLTSLLALLTNPWLFWQYLHTLLGSLVTACFVVAGLGAFYLLRAQHEAYGRLFLSLGVAVGVFACAAMAFPTGDGQGKNVARHQPAALAAMEGLFETRQGAPMVLIGQPDMERLRLDNPIEVPRVLSLLTWSRWTAEVKGLDAFPREEWPDNVPLLYYSYHIMVGLGTIFIAVMGGAALLLWRGRLHASRPMLWLLMLAAPFPLIANNMGWNTAELGRQPWLVHGLMRTAEGTSPHVSSGNVLFVLLGFMGMYALFGLLYLFLAAREIEHGPEGDGGAHEPALARRAA